MFELAGDLRLLKESRPERGVFGVLGPQLLQGNVPSQVAVVSQPHASDAAGRVQMEPVIALPLRERSVVSRRLRFCPKGIRGERALDVVTLGGAERTCAVVGGGQ